MLLKLGYRESEILLKSQEEVKGILKAYNRLDELASGKTGQTHRIRRKKK